MKIFQKYSDSRNRLSGGDCVEKGLSAEKGSGRHFMKQMDEKQLVVYVTTGIQLLLCFFAVASGIGKWNREKNKQRKKQLAYEGKLHRKEQKAAFKQQQKKNQLQWKREYKQEKRQLKA